MQVAAGAMSPLLRKLGDLLMAEFTLSKRTRKRIESLQRELTVMYPALHKVAEVPREQLDPVIRAWASQVRELSYDMEDAVDAYMVRVKEEDQAGDPANLMDKIKKFVKETSRLLKKGKRLHQIAAAVDEAQDLARQLGELQKRYGLDLHDANAAGASAIDPRLTALYEDVREHVGINGRSEELIDMLELAPDGPEHLLKTVSIVGFGGLGKTTLARVLYDKILKSHFDCGAFVSIGRNPDTNKVFKDILYGLDNGKYGNIHNTAKDVKLLIDDVRCYLENKRYFIIIDDIWDEKMWGVIKCAFPENNRPNRVITTTRIISVSEKCCASHHAIYKMKPLSRDDSETLFCKRIFTDGKGCPQYLSKILDGLLKKCGGVPLAIITIASLLANKQAHTEEWNTVLKSIGRGMTEGGTMEDMRKILSFSYHDLPSYLKVCLLYMSVFPEDHIIRRDRLILMWTAEGLLQHKEQENRLFELGKCCFNELINRSMMQLVDYRGEEACRLHDMMLDLICHLSREDNFVSTLDDVGQSTDVQTKARRLSLQVQDCRVEHTSALAIIDLSNVRSFTDFGTTTNLIPSLARFHFLRVLDLEGCDLRKGGDHDLSHMSKLFHLRYLGLRGTHIGEIPSGIGKLRFLQTLDLEFADIEELPSAVIHLGHLMCLRVDPKTKLPKLPDGTGHLTSLLVLSGINMSRHPDFVRELRNMTVLRELDIWWDVRDDKDKSLQKVLVESLCNLEKIQTLLISSYESLDIMGDCWVAPPHLRRFELIMGGYFTRMPAWIKRDPLLLTELSILDISFNKLVLAEDMQILGRLPALVTLKIDAPTKRLLIGPGFPCLRSFIFMPLWCGLVMFEPGAMPRVEYVGLAIGVREVVDNGSYGADDRGLMFGLGNLLSLERAVIRLSCEGSKAHEQEQVDAAITQESRDHPNNITLELVKFEWTQHRGRAAC